MKSCLRSRFSFEDLKVQKWLALDPNILLALRAPDIKGVLAHQVPGPVDLLTALRPPLTELSDLWVLSLWSSSVLWVIYWAPPKDSEPTPQWSYDSSQVCHLTTRLSSMKQLHRQACSDSASWRRCHRDHQTRQRILWCAVLTSWSGCCWCWFGVFSCCPENVCMLLWSHKLSMTLTF